MNPGSVQITPCAIPPPAPTIISITPAVWNPGVTTNITITGTGFIGNGPNYCNPTTLNATAPTESQMDLINTNVLSSTQITATVTPLASDPAETATVTPANYVYNSPPQGPYYITGAAATAQIVPGCAPPTVASVSPNIWFAGQTYDSVKITGTNFITPAKATAACPATTATLTGASFALGAVTVNSASLITIASVAPPSSEPTETATITVSGNPAATTTAQILSAPKVTLQRVDLMDIQATGTPVGGTFSLTTQVESGTTTGATIGFASGSTSTTNPTTLELTEPANPSPIGSYSPGGLEQITVNYATHGKTPSDQFQVPTFGMSCYDTTLQSDWGTAPNNCQSLTINKVKYSGTVTNPAGLPKGTYCSLFIAEAKLQGSAVLNSGQDIQYIGGKLVQVSTIATHDGTPPVANQTVARYLSIIPGKGVLMDLDQVGTGLLANDTGGDITGYRIDLYKGVGKAVCANYDNIMAVGACTPATSGCPASAVQ
jgi:3D (Asp-Asp-Asp) domain-containing protein